jgi:hypothetical protein
MKNFRFRTVGSKIINFNANKRQKLKNNEDDFGEISSEDEEEERFKKLKEKIHVLEVRIRTMGESHEAVLE